MTIVTASGDAGSRSSGLGLYRYNNQDHAMLTGMLAARKVINGTRFDLPDYA